MLPPGHQGRQEAKVANLLMSFWTSKNNGSWVYSLESPRKELSISRINFHGPNHVRAIEVLL